ncbi:MAG: hypothetical protein Q9210_004762 [Variospora velana]
MYITSIAFVFYILASVTAAPTIPAERSFSRQVSDSTVTVEVCTGESFTGHCQHFKGLRGICYNFPNGFNLNVTSIDPSTGTACDLYEESDCWERYEGYPGPPPLAGIVNPGVRNLEHQHWNKRKHLSTEFHANIESVGRAVNGLLEDDKHGRCDDGGDSGVQGGEKSEDGKWEGGPACVYGERRQKNGRNGQACAGQEKGEHPAGGFAYEREGVNDVGRESD